MTDFLGIPMSALIPGVLGIYALGFLAGGIYYLEQRVARIRDQFPKRGFLARMTGYSALGIGVLAFICLGGYLVSPSPEYQVGATIAAVAGVGFWVFRVHFDLTPGGRIRDGVLGLICAALSLLLGWWVNSL